MVFLKNIKEKMKPISQFSEILFIELHRYVEGYLRRLLLIGLRLHEVQYKQAQKIIELTFLNKRALIEKSFTLISYGTFALKQAKKEYPRFAISADLFFNFTSPYRNWLVHGVHDNIHDPELLECLCRSDRQFIIEFEKILRDQFHRSAFDKPGDWGAQKGKKEENIPALIKRLGLKKVLKGAPMSLTEAKNRLEKLQ